MDNWDKKFLALAKEVSTWSKDPSTKIGAVIVGKNKNVLSTGYNGFPRGVDDCCNRLNHRETKYKYVVHGELNAIINAAFLGVSLNGSTIYIHGLPVCEECSKSIIQAGIKRVVMNVPKDVPEKWKESYKFSQSIFNEVGIIANTFYY